MKLTSTTSGLPPIPRGYDRIQGALANVGYHISDQTVGNVLREHGIEPAPDLTPHIERFMRSIKEECLLKMIFFGETSLRRATTSYLVHYHGERNHQGLSNKIIDPSDHVGRSQGDVECREHLGGLLRYYYRAAA